VSFVRLRAPSIGVILSIACAVVSSIASFAAADLPGVLPLSAAGDGHVWWVVKSEPQPGDPASIPSKAADFVLMHHGVDEPAPSERLVMRFALEPQAIAAEGPRVVVVTRGQGGGAGDRGAGLFIISMFAVKNEVTGHWGTLPRGSPILLAKPSVDGDVRAMAIAHDTLTMLLRVRRADARTPERYWLGSISCESGANAVWVEQPLPALDLMEPTRLFARDGAIAALGSKDGVATMLMLGAAAPSVVQLRTPSAPIDPRSIVGAFELSKRTVLVERTLGVGTDSQLRLGILRDGLLQPWADFPEPRRPWSVGPFGGSAMVLELGDRGRASTRMLSFSAFAPDALATELLPPGFASGSWIHMPIIGALSMALVLAAMIFGSEAYLDNRPRVAVGAGAVAAGSGATAQVRTARGASLGRRASAMLVDLLPGMVVVWFFVRANPFDLLQIPAFQPDITLALPSVFVFGAGWLVATLGDVLFGRSMGKRTVGLRIIAARGGPAPVSRRLLRSLASLIVVASPVVMLLSLLHPRGDGPAEMLSGTAVVDESEADAGNPIPGAGGNDAG
jgi:uncharacterized RDD family membrane protein YckC